MTIAADLDNTDSAEIVLEILGAACGYDSAAVWGRNWDAFNDILRHLETGGIWGMNKPYGFPLLFNVSNFESFQAKWPEKFKILVEILEDAKQFYARRNLTFDYIFLR
jgi:hypothetical protein